MDLIQGDLLSANSTPPRVCLVFSCRGKRSSSGHTVRLCSGKQAKEAMLSLHAHSFMCIIILSVCLSVCLSLCLTYRHMPPTVRSVCDVWLPFLLNHYTIHRRAPTKHLFSQCEWITFQCCLTIKGVQVFKQIPFMLSEKLCHTAVCQYATTKADGI